MEERNNGGGGGSRGSQTPPTQLSLLYLRLPGMADRRQRVGACSTPRAAPCLRVVVVLVVVVVALLLHGRGRVVALSA